MAFVSRVRLAVVAMLALFSTAGATQDAGTILRTYFPGADVARWY